MNERTAARLTDFLEGARVAVPIMVAVSPFGVLFGALAVANGLSVGEAALLSATVFAGASQMVGIELFGQNVAPWLIVFSIFAVNFRHVLYSAACGRKIAQWGPARMSFGMFFLTDPQYAETERRYEAGYPVTLSWYLGLALPLYASFLLLSVVGAMFGRLITDPHAMGIDFLLPIYFLSLVMAFRKRPLWLPVVAASATASIIAWNIIGSPWHVSFGALAGILVAAIAPVRNGGNGDG